MKSTFGQLWAAFIVRGSRETANDHVAKPLVTLPANSYHYQ